MICCADGCGHKAGYGCHFYNFPSPNDGPDWEKWYNIWVLRVNRLNADGSVWRPETLHTKLCSCHFRPEDQWDPKSRKGGLKCKEPVFFESANNLPEEVKRITAKVKSRRKPGRATTFKIREYFENKDSEANEHIGLAKNMMEETVHISREQEQFTCTANLPTNCQQGPQLQEDMMPGVHDTEAIEVDTDNTVCESTAHETTAHEIDIKHEPATSPLHFKELSLPSKQSNSTINVKIEVDDSSVAEESVLKFNKEVIPRVLSISAVECHERREEQDTEEQASVFPQFAGIPHRNITPKDSLEADLPKKKTPKAKISNVRPIRISTSTNLGSQERTNPSMQFKTMYDQMYDGLRTSGSQSQAEPMQATLSQNNVFDIADILGDTERSVTNTCTSFQLNLNQALNKIQELENTLSSHKFSMQRFCGSDEKIKFYTGFISADTLMRFFWRIEPDTLTSDRSNKWQCALDLTKEVLKESTASVDVSQKVLPYIDEFFLFLCYVWLGLQPEDLADRFALPSPTCAQFIILRWIFYLNATLPCTSERVRSTSASKMAGFQGQYRNTKLLLHQMEIRVQQKSIVGHMSSSKLEALVGFSPSGEVIYTSNVLPELSNRDLDNSGVLSLLQLGDGVIVESGFVSELFSSYGVVMHNLPKLDMPHDPTTLQLGTSSKCSHMRHTEVTRLLSAKHVGCVAGFNVFQNVVLNPFANRISDLWRVCCRLVNYQQGHRSL